MVYLNKYDITDFVEMVDSNYGWSVSNQAKDILTGESLDEQNPNALKLIMELAKRKGEIELAETIEEYLT